MIQLSMAMREDTGRWNQNLGAKGAEAFFAGIKGGIWSIKADFLFVVVGFPCGDLFTGDGAIDAKLGCPAIAAFLERLAVVNADEIDQELAGDGDLLPFRIVAAALGDTPAIGQPANECQGLVGLPGVDRFHPKLRPRLKCVLASDAKIQSIAAHGDEEIFPAPVLLRGEELIASGGPSATGWPLGWRDGEFFQSRRGGEHADVDIVPGSEGGDFGGVTGGHRKQRDTARHAADSGLHDGLPRARIGDEEVNGTRVVAIRGQSPDFVEASITPAG